jgi:hypothetical protein
MRHRQTRFLVLASLGIWALAAAGFGSDTIKLKVTAETANIRVKPSIGSNIIRQFPAGAILEAEQKEGEWYLIKLDPDEAGNVTGYVHESLVMPLNQAPVAAPPVAAVPPPVVKAPETKPAAKVPAPKTEVVMTARDKPAVYEVTDEILADAGAESPFSLAVWGGGGLTLVGDLNTGAKGLADFYEAQTGGIADKTVSPVRAGLQLGGEAMVAIAPGLKIAFGAEYIWASRESALTLSADPLNPSTLTVKPGFSALPIHLAVVYYPVNYLYLKAGVGYYFARTDYRYAFTYGESLRDWQGEATAGGAGLLGGIGLDLSLARGLGLTAELCGRYAVITGFTGSDTYADENLAEPYIEEGRLYAYDARTSSQTAYSLIFIRGKKPAESGVENAREAKLDLSGISLKIGFKYKF